MMMKIRELEKDFTKKGVRHVQLSKNDDFVIYRCSSLDYDDVYFEVFKYRQASPHPMDAGDWDKVELYPSDNAFGVWAWCCSNADCVQKVLDKHFDCASAKIFNVSCLMC